MKKYDEELKRKILSVLASAPATAQTIAYALDANLDHVRASLHDMVADYQAFVGEMTPKGKLFSAQPVETLKERILALLETGQTFGTAQIADRLGETKKRVSTVVDGLKRGGLIRIVFMENKVAKYGLNTSAANEPARPLVTISTSERALLAQEWKGTWMQGMECFVQ